MIRVRTNCHYDDGGYYMTSRSNASTHDRPELVKSRAAREAIVLLDAASDSDRCAVIEGVGERIHFEYWLDEVFTSK